LGVKREEKKVKGYEDIVEDMGYKVARRIRMHYCIPILSIERNGLRQVRSDSDTEFMLTFVSLGHLFCMFNLIVMRARGG
jgi:hypothetical protein